MSALYQYPSLQDLNFEVYFMTKNSEYFTRVTLVWNKFVLLLVSLDYFIKILLDFSGEMGEDREKKEILSPNWLTNKCAGLTYKCQGNSQPVSAPRKSCLVSWCQELRSNDIRDFLWEVSWILWMPWLSPFPLQRMLINQIVKRFYHVWKNTTWRKLHAKWNLPILYVQLVQ